LDSFGWGAIAFISISSVPTPKLLSYLTLVTFVADHHDDIKAGLQQFIAMDGSEEH
jgi:hypothetical protein